MKQMLTGGVAAIALLATTAHADTMQNPTLIKNLEDFPNQRVTVSGVVSWVEDSNEFTLADNTGDIEVNLANKRVDIEEGEYVTVSGVVDTYMIDELDNASVSVHEADYDRWSDSYNNLYNVRYDLNGIDATFYDTADWNNDLYDDYWVITN